MKDIEVWDTNDLRDITAVLTERAKRSVWDVVEYVDPTGEAYFDIAGPQTELFNALVNTGRRISGADFLREALTTPQVIWGTFRAFDNAEADLPWLLLDGVDSTFWRIRTRDIPTRQAMLKAFRQTKQTGSQA